MIRSAMTAGLLFLFAGSAIATDNAMPNLEHTPGARPYAQAMEDFRNDRMFSARHNFLLAALWADKIAQYNLGVVHYQGHGVPVDRPRAWAWFDLAAERGYPQLVDMAALVWEEFDEREQVAARDIREELAERYSDVVAVPRTARYMELEQRRMTGSRVGMIGNLTIITGDGVTRSGEDFYRRENRDFHTIVARETALYRRLNTGRVEISDIEVLEEEKDKP